MRVDKDGIVHWSLGSIVIVTIYTDEHDPNNYYARCLTGGTWPRIQVLHPKYPEPFDGKPQGCPYVILRELTEEETEKVLADLEGVELPDPEATYDVKSDETPSNSEVSDEHLCAECGKSLLQPSPGCSVMHLGGDAPFTAF